MGSNQETTGRNNGGGTQPTTSGQTEGIQRRQLPDTITPHRGGEVDMSEMDNPFKDSRIGEPELYSLADYECEHGNLRNEGQCDCE